MSGPDDVLGGWRPRSVDMFENDTSGERKRCISEAKPDLPVLVVDVEAINVDTHVHTKMEGSSLGRVKGSGRLE